MADRFLDKVYRTTGQAATTRLYDDWAASYDEEVRGEGYATPDRAARALASLIPGEEAGAVHVLDYGCGTGLSGAALQARGFGAIDGCDPSQGMIEIAGRKGVYRDLWRLDPANPFARDFRQRYDVIASIGVISTGAAPPSVLGQLYRALPQGGRLLFSYNSHTLADEAYMGALDEVLADPHAVLDLSEDGEHLPGIGVTSCVMVIRYE